jgi:hypothetical protein
VYDQYGAFTYFQEFDNSGLEGVTAISLDTSGALIGIVFKCTSGTQITLINGNDGQEKFTLTSATSYIFEPRSIFVMSTSMYLGFSDGTNNLLY